MGDQQESTKLGWLTGMLEADGWITVNAYKTSQTKRGWSIKAVVGVCGQDGLVIEEVDRLWRDLGVVGHIQEGSTPKGNRTILAITTSKLSNVRTLLTALLPYMVGEKTARARLALRYVAGRLERGAQGREHDNEDFEVLREWASRFSGVNKGNRLTNLRAFLTDYTRTPA